MSLPSLLFTKVPRWEALSTREQMLYHADKDKYDKTARKGSKNLFFAKSRTDNETWVPLIESVPCFMLRCFGSQLTQTEHSGKLLQSCTVTSLVWRADIRVKESRT